MRFNKNLILNGVIGASLVSPIILNNVDAFATTNDANIDNNTVITVNGRTALAALDAAEQNPTKENVAAARELINEMPEGALKDGYQARLNALFANNFTLSRENVSANLDVYIKSENMLSLSLDTNSVTFEDYSGVEDMEKLGAVTISINSSLPYDLNAYMPTQIQNADKSETLPISTLNIREDSEGVYQTFANTTDKLVLKADNVAGNNLTHTIDLKLADRNAHPADVYKTVIKFEAQQK